MSDLGQGESKDLPLAQSLGVGEVLATLQQAGAAQFDAVHLHYLNLLAARCCGQSGAVKRVLETRLVQALSVFKARFEQAQTEARVTIEQTCVHYPDATADLHKRLAAGDIKGVRQAIAALKSNRSDSLLGRLVCDLAQRPAALADARFERGFQLSAGLRPELKAARYFRETWSKLSVDKRVAQALTQAPKNAGPMNSHNLVLRSLALMRDISPDYLNHFTSYVDTLLCLDNGDKAKHLPAKLVPDVDARQKAKTRRGRLR